MPLFPLLLYFHSPCFVNVSRVDREGSDFQSALHWTNKPSQQWFILKQIKGGADVRILFVTTHAGAHMQTKTSFISKPVQICYSSLLSMTLQIWTPWWFLKYSLAFIKPSSLSLIVPEYPKTHHFFKNSSKSAENNCWSRLQLRLHFFSTSTHIFHLDLDHKQSTE